MPVSRSPGTMNRICWKIEDAFKVIDVFPEVEFDYSILKSNVCYGKDDYDSILLLYDEYNNSMQRFLKGERKNDSDKEYRTEFKIQLSNRFYDECCAICPNTEVLTNILIDICYTSEKNKSFAWELVGEQIYKNVLKNNNNIIRFPVKDEDGDICFCGQKFVIREMKIGDDTDVDFE